MYNRNELDKQAEAEAEALRKQGRDYKHGAKRIRLRDGYNITTFNKLFKD